ncbi:MAG: isochorismatase family cysteine hydrolase [Bryobacteraceae bacterium]|jgi:nicotinamidase/pyrazinamidase
MKLAFFDIDTQFDFLLPSGALYVPRAEHIISAVARLNRFAAGRGFALVSTADAHSEHDPEFASWPPHCIAGTLGQHKPEATLLERRVVVPNRAGSYSISGAPQVVLEKQSVNVFDTETIGPLLAHLDVDGYIVYGVVTEVCVLNAARGLLGTDKPVTVVEDAIAHLTAAGSAKALEELRQLGATIGTVASVTACHNCDPL